MKDTSHVTKRRAEREVFAAKPTHVRPLERRHARVGAQARVQLAVADVECADPRGAGLQEAVGEAARRGPDVQAILPDHVDLERLERVRELLAPTGDEARPALDLERGGLVDLLPRLRVSLHAPGEDERLRLRAAFGEPTLDQQDVQPLLHAGSVPPAPAPELSGFPQRGRGQECRSRIAATSAASTDVSPASAASRSCTRARVSSASLRARSSP